MTKIESHHWVGVGAFIMFPLAVFAPLGYSILFPVIAWGAFALHYFHHKKLALFPRRTLFLLIAAHVWAAVTVFWSIHTERSLILSGSLSALTATGIILWKVTQSYSQQERNFIFNMLAIGLGLGAILLGIESVSDGMILKIIKSEPDLPLYKFNKATSIFTILVWPVVIGLFQRNQKILGGFLFAIVAGGVFAFQSDTSKFAFIVGGLAFGLAYRFRKIATLTAGGLFFLILVMPLLSQTIFKFENFQQISPIRCKGSLLHRLNIWEYVGKQIQLKPLSGWGLDTARSKQFSHDIVEYPVTNKKTGEQYLKTLPALLLHPHNAALQWWLELGLIGVLILSFLISQIPWELRTWTLKLSRAAAFASFSAASIIALISYGIWQNWWVSVLWLSVIMNQVSINRNEPGSSNATEPAKNKENGA